MKLISQIVQLIHQMEVVSKKILAAGYIIALFIYLCAVIILSFYIYIYNDTTTGLYWYHEMIALAVDCMIVCIIPVLLFEIILIWSGNKKGEKK